MATGVYERTKKHLALLAKAREKLKLPEVRLKMSLAHKKAPLDFECAHCKTIFKLPQHSLNSRLRHGHKNIFCSSKCAGGQRIKLPQTFTCRRCNTPFPNTNGDKRRVYCSRGCSDASLVGKPSNNGYTWTAKQRERMSGANSAFWRGGVATENVRLRASKRYVDWRTHVFKRDDYTCQACGQRGGKLNADHELPFSLFPALRFEILNGRTFCVPCHRKTPTYGNKPTRTIY